MDLQLREQGITGDEVAGCRKGARGGRGGAAGRGEGEAPFDSVEVGTLVESKGELMPERRGGCVIQQGPEFILFAGAEDFGTFGSREAGRCVKCIVDGFRQDMAELIVHHPWLAAGGR
jgi:hypothetical protein